MDHACNEDEEEESKILMGFYVSDYRLLMESLSTKATIYDDIDAPTEQARSYFEIKALHCRSLRDRIRERLISGGEDE